MENKNIKILAIDDNRDNLISLKAIISEVLPESKVYIELSGQDGIGTARKIVPDVILLDIVMPGMDGYQVCKTLKSDEQLSETPIIFLTALKGDKQSRILALEAGAEAFIAKPIDEIELKAQIKAMLKIKEAAAFKKNEKLRLEALVQKRTEELKSANIAALNLLEDLKTENEIRKQREAELKMSKVLLSQTENIGKVGGWSFNIDTMEQKWTDEVYRIHEVEISSEPDVHTGINYYTKESKSIIEKAVQRAIEYGEDYDLELEIITAKGNTRSVHTIGKADLKNRRIYGFFQDVTERKQAEEIKKELLKQLELISLHLPGVIYQFKLRPDGTFHFPYASPGIYNIYGVQPKDVENDATVAFKAIHPDDLEQVSVSINHSAQTLTPWHDIYRTNQSSGKTIWVEGNSTPQKLEDGSIIWHGFIQDITNRKQSEDNLKLLNHAIEASSVSVAITDVEGNIIYVNPFFTKLTRYSCEEVIGKNLRILKSGNQSKEFYKDLWDTILSGKNWTGELLNKKKNGELFWEKAVISPMLNSNGVVTNFVTIKEDITERKKIMQELVVAKDHAEESEIRLLEAQKITKVGSWETDLTNLKTMWSDETYRIFEINPTTFQATHQTFLNFVHPDDKKIVDEAFAKSFETNTFNSIEHRIITSKDTIKYVEERWKIIFNEEEKPTRAIGTCQDITERKQAEQALNEAKERAEQSDQLKSAFLANMSHEIRTPMNGILGFAELLKKPDLTGEKQQQYIKIIEKSGARMLNMINDIVSISKIESGTMEIHLKETNINNQLQFVYDVLRLDAEKKNLQLSLNCEITEKEVIIKTDSDKFYGILSNLVKNAIKYTDSGTIEFGYTDKGKEFEFYVKDTGIGIPKEKQEAIFERFIQADIEDKMARQGAGLGLAISRAYVAMLGGKIWVESKIDEGSIFYFTIPSNSESAVETLISQHKKLEINKDVKKLKILIAEDDEVSEMLLDETVKMFGKEILKARTGVEAVEICRNNPDINLILMDIQMPEMSGYKASNQIREFNKEVIIIAQTAYGLSGDREKSIESGCNDYIKKPINKTALQAMIQKYS